MSVELKLMEYSGDMVRLRRLSNGDLQILSVDGRIIRDTIPAWRLQKYEPERPSVNSRRWHFLKVCGLLLMTFALFGLVLIGLFACVDALIKALY